MNNSQNNKISWFSSPVDRFKLELRTFNRKDIAPLVGVAFLWLPYHFYKINLETGILFFDGLEILLVAVPIYAGATSISASDKTFTVSQCISLILGFIILYELARMNFSYLVSLPTGTTEQQDFVTAWTQPLRIFLIETFGVFTAAFVGTQN